MKIMRYFPFIALGILCFIIYGLFKTSHFINKKVDSQILLSQDSLINKHTDSIRFASYISANSIMPDTLSPSLTLLPQPEQRVAVASHSRVLDTLMPPIIGLKGAKGRVPTTLGETEPTQTANNVSQSATKKVAVSAQKTGNLGETPAKTMSSKTNSTKVVAKPALVKATTPIAPTVKGDMPKSASISVKTEKNAPYFYVIIGSYTQEANAKTRAAAFEQKNNKKARIIKQSGYFRVCADEFTLESLAAQYSQKLKKAGEDNIIVKF